jgi:predicted DCC family thiol-disulfide oxidoreductase YuxK
MSMPASVITVFYDGHCGLCHGFIRFLLARDPGGEKFDFAPLQGSFFATVVCAPAYRIASWSRAMLGKCS